MILLSRPRECSGRPPTDMTRILIADDHEVVRSGLRKILEARPDWEVVAEVADGRDAVRKAVELNHHLVIGCDGEITNYPAARWMRSAAPHATIAARSEHWQGV